MRVMTNDSRGGAGLWCCHHGAGGHRLRRAILFKILVTLISVQVNRYEMIDLDCWCAIVIATTDRLIYFLNIRRNQTPVDVQCILYTW